MEFWPNVQKVLVSRGMTAKALAAQIGASPAALSTYSRGTVPSLDVAWRISRTLGVSLDELTSGVGSASKEECPSPDDHRLLRELLDELGLGEIAAVARLGALSSLSRVAEVLAEHYPRSISEAGLRKALSDLDDKTLEGSLIGLRRRGLVIERPDDGGKSYALVNPSVDLVTRGDIGGPFPNALRAVRLLLSKILPAVERRDESAHLTTLTARISRADAEAVSRDLYTLLLERARSCRGPGEGDTDLFLAFGVAVESQT